MKSKMGHMINRLIGMLLVLGMVVACDSRMTTTGSGGDKISGHPMDQSKTYFADQLIITLKGGISVDRFLYDIASNRDFKVRLIEWSPIDPQTFLAEIDGASIEMARQVLGKHVLVEALSLNGPVYAFESPKEEPLPRDPLFENLWGLKNNGQEVVGLSTGKVGADIGVLKAWSITKGSRDVVVAVIDTGIDYRHPDLAKVRVSSGTPMVIDSESNIWMNPGETPGDGLDNDGNGLVDDVYGWNFVVSSNDPMDDHGHGTHCSGTIAALEGNLFGVVGVAPRTKVMAVKFLSGTGGGTLRDAGLAIRYIVGMQKRFPQKRFIMSNSWGMTGKVSDLDKNNYLLLAVKEAEKANIPFIVAAGNSSWSIDEAENYDTPASFPLTNVIAVAATTPTDRLAYFSSYGYKSVHVAAPGLNILSTVPKQLYGKEFAVFSGTSMATPHVSGVVALLLAQNPKLQPSEIRDLLMATSDPVDDLFGYVMCGGRVNVARALLGDRNPASSMQMTVAPYELSSIRDYREPFDKMSKIVHKGADQIRLHFASLDIDQSDYVQILDKKLRVIIEYHGMQNDFWTPPVKGDTIYVRHWIAPPIGFAFGGEESRTAAGKSSDGGGGGPANGGYHVDSYEYGVKTGEGGKL